MENIGKTLLTAKKRAQYEMNWLNEKGPKLFEIMDRKLLKETYRLPRVAQPEAYDIYIKPYLENSTFDGNVTIGINIINRTCKIVLNADDMEINRIMINGTTPASYKYNETMQTLTIYFERIIEANENISLSIEYRGNLRETMRGFYKSSYMDEGGNKR